MKETRNKQCEALLEHKDQILGAPTVSQDVCKRMVPQGRAMIQECLRSYSP